MVGPPMIWPYMPAAFRPIHVRVELVHRTLLHIQHLAHSKLLVAIHHACEVHLVLNATVISVEPKLVHALHGLLIDVVHHLVG